MSARHNRRPCGLTTELEVVAGMPRGAAPLSSDSGSKGNPMYAPDASNTDHSFPIKDRENSGADRALSSLSDDTRRYQEEFMRSRSYIYREYRVARTLAVSIREHFLKEMKHDTGQCCIRLFTPPLCTPSHSSVSI